MQVDVQQIDARITWLNDKLGLERSQLWDAIVRQAKVEAWTDLALAGIGLLLAIAAVILLPRIMKWGRAEGDGGDWPAAAIIGTILCLVALIAGTVIALINGYNAAQILPNPVYYAYTHLVY